MPDLLIHCRYYKGEETCPKEISERGLESIWYYENLWVNREDLHSKNCENVQEFKHYAQPLYVDPSDPTPLTLKALFFNRHKHWTYGTFEDFIKWYRETYLGIPGLNTDNDG